MTDYPPEDVPTEPTPIVTPEEPTAILPVVPAATGGPVPVEPADRWRFELTLAAIAVAVLLIGGAAAFWATRSSTPAPDRPHTVLAPSQTHTAATGKSPSTTAQTAPTPPVLVTVPAPPPAVPEPPTRTSRPVSSPSPRPTSPPPPGPTAPAPTTVAPTTTPPTSPATT